MTQKKLKLIIVEDDEHDYELLSRVLKKCDISFEQVWLRDGEEAINFLDNTKASPSNEFIRNVFFVDINLPMIDGLELIKMIRNHPSTKEDYVITLTGSNSKTDMETALKNGANLYIEKPFGKEKILEFSNLICSKLNFQAD
jgi:two-component system response regulator